MMRRGGKWNEWKNDGRMEGGRGGEGEGMDGKNEKEPFPFPSVPQERRNLGLKGERGRNIKEVKMEMKESKRGRGREGSHRQQAEFGRRGKSLVEFGSNGTIFAQNVQFWISNYEGMWMKWQVGLERESEREQGEWFPFFYGQNIAYLAKWRRISKRPPPPETGVAFCLDNTFHHSPKGRESAWKGS